MCTAMLFDPAEKKKEFEDKMKKITHKATLLERIENAIRKGLEKFESGEKLFLLSIRTNKDNRL
jgi:exonuclease VII small subunit